MRYFLYILSLECLMVLGFFQLNMASILYLGFAVVVALASGVDAQSPRRCSSVSLIIQDNNPFLLPLPLYLFVTSCLVLFQFPRDTCPVGYNCVNGYCEGTRQLLKHNQKLSILFNDFFSESKIINVLFSFSESSSPFPCRVSQILIFYHIPSNSDRRLSPINVELLFFSLTSNVPETTNVSEASV